jgi:hypothetical protein
MIKNHLRQSSKLVRCKCASEVAAKGASQRRNAPSDAPAYRRETDADVKLNQMAKSIV